MLLLKQRDKVPPGGWRYVDPESGHEFRAPNPHLLVQRVVDHYHTNGKVPPTDMHQLIDDYICRNIPDPDLKCKDVDPPSFAGKVLLAAQAMTRIAKAKGKVMVSAEQLAERQNICEQCPGWNGTAVLGYGACKVCGCTGLKLYLATENCPAEKWPTI